MSRNSHYFNAVSKFRLNLAYILTEIHFIIKNEEKEKIKQTTAELENMQNDNAKMYEAVKKIKHRRPLQKVLMKGKNDLTAKTRRAK